MFFLPSYTGFLSPKSWGLKCCTMYSTTSLQEEKPYTDAGLICIRNRRRSCSDNSIHRPIRIFYCDREEGEAVIEVIEYRSSRTQLAGVIFHGHGRWRGEDKKSEGVGSGAHRSMKGALAFIYVWGMWVCTQRKRSKVSTFVCLLRTFVSKRKRPMLVPERTDTTTCNFLQDSSN